MPRGFHCLHPLIAQVSPRYENALDLVKIGITIAGVGILIAGMGVAFAKIKDPGREIGKNTQRIVGGLLMAIGVGVALYGQLGF